MAADASTIVAARWLLQPEELINVVGDPDDAFFRTKLSPDGLAIVARCGRGKAVIWNVSDSKDPVQELPLVEVDESELGSETLDVAAAILRGRAQWSPDGAKLAILSSAARFQIWERELPRGLFAAAPLEFSTNQQGWPDLAWSPDGSWIAMWLAPLNRLRRCRSSGGLSAEHGKLWIYDARKSGSEPVELDHGDFEVRGALWSADSRLIIAWCLRHQSGESGKVCVWDLRNLSCRELHHGQAHVCHVAWSPVPYPTHRVAIRSEIATVSSDGLLRIWDMNAETLEPHELDTQVRQGLDAQHVSWAPDCTRLVTSSIRAGWRVCGVRPDDVLLFELKHGSTTDRSDSALSSPLNRRVVLAGDQLEQLPPPQVWDLCASKKTSIYLKHDETECSKVAHTFETVRSWSPDSELLAVVSRATRKSVTKVVDHDPRPTKHLVSEEPIAIKVWLWPTSHEQQGAGPVELEGLRNLEVHELSWSKDSLLVIAACEEGTARLFETQRGTPLSIIGQNWNYGQQSWWKGAMSVRFLPCGRLIAVSSRSTHMDADTEDCDSIRVYGPSLEASAYKYMMDLSLASGGLPADPHAALQGAQQLLKALEAWCLEGEQSGLRQMSQVLTKRVLEKRERFGSDSTLGAFCADLPPIEQEPLTKWDWQHRDQLRSDSDLCAFCVGLSPIELAYHGAQFEAAAMWSSCEQVDFCGVAREFAWFVNFAIDVDDPALLHACMLILLSLDRFTVAQRHPSLPPVRWPCADAAGNMIMWRGGGFNEAWCQHFARGMRHRIPGYIPLSTDREQVRQHMQAATSRQEPAIEWCFEIDAAYTDILYLGGLLAPYGQEDFALRPYTAVEVVDVHWQDVLDGQRVTCDNPHRITLRVLFDKSLSANNLPIAPWR